MKFVVPVLLSVMALPLISNAQEKSITYYSSEGKVTERENSLYFETGLKDGDVYIDSVTSYFTKTNKLRSAEKRDEKGRRQNLYVEYFENGNLSERTMFKDGVQADSSSVFYETGNPKSVYFYSEKRDFTDLRDPKLIHYWDSTGVQVVKNGEGKCGCKYSWGPFEYFEEGIVRDGYRDGEWKGFRKDTLQYEEVYEAGELQKGIHLYNGQRMNTERIKRWQNIREDFRHWQDFLERR